MNILGEGFPKEIVKQVEIRQKNYGSGYTDFRTADQIKFLNGNSSWCKLISAMTVTNNNAINNVNIKGLTGDDDSLARNFILFNGTYSDGFDQRSGFGTFDSTSYNKATDTYSYPNSAYTNWGNSFLNSDFGYRPMAGIQSATITHKNRGSIRAAKVKIKAWDKVSFEIIDVLYLRLGFTVLLEWGNSMYYDNNNTLQTNVDNSLANEFLDANVTYYKFLDKIKDQREISEGNYDAMLGKVTNFHWTFNNDGSYDITLDLISAGDIIESFKIKGNVPSEAKKVGGITATASAASADPNDLSYITDYLSKYGGYSDLTQYFSNMVKVLNAGWFMNTHFVRGATKGSMGRDPYRYYLDPSSIFHKTNQPKDGCVVAPPSPIVLGGLTFPNNHVIAPQYYIRLGNLLEFIEDNIMYKVYNTKGGGEKILYFDTSVSTNLMHAPEQLMSYDPRVCMVKRDMNFNLSSPFFPINGTYFDQTKNHTGTHVVGADFADGFMSGAVSNTGKIMNIYLNMRHILVKISELSDPNSGDLKLIDFLKSLLTDINGAFGGFSDLDLFIDETTNTVKIIDKNPLPDRDAALRLAGASLNYALFDLYGYNNTSTTGSASFIRDFKFNTELTPEFSTMITVAATSNGTAVGENNTALSRLNKGLRDKYKKTINSGKSTIDPSKKAEYKNIYDSARSEFIDISNNLEEYLFYLISFAWNDEMISSYKNYINVYNQAYKKYTNAWADYDDFDDTIPKAPLKKRFQPGTGFIPFNLSLTMDGLSGMKIGSKFYIDTKFLPSNYPDVVSFLIKNMTHEIKENKWTTTLESYCIAEGESNNPTVTPAANPTRRRAPSSTPSANCTDILTPKDSTVTYRATNTGFIWPLDDMISYGGGLGRAKQKRNNILPTKADDKAGSDQHDGYDLNSSQKRSDPLRNDFKSCVGGKGTNGSRIYSVGDGTVARASAAGGFGYVVTIEHKVGTYYYLSVYGHVPLDGIFVRKGDTVKLGQQIAVMGTEGRSGGYHLHFELYRWDKSFISNSVDYPASLGYTDERINTLKLRNGIELLDPYDYLAVFASNGGPITGNILDIKNTWVR